jgi:hypothetical protein
MTTAGTVQDALDALQAGDVATCVELLEGLLDELESDDSEEEDDGGSAAAPAPRVSATRGRLW